MVFWGIFFAYKEMVSPNERAGFFCLPFVPLHKIVLRFPIFIERNINPNRSALKTFE